MAHPDIADIYELTPTQQGMLFHTLLDPEAGEYFEQLACTLLGDLDSVAFAAAWQGLVDRNPVFRTSFLAERAGKPLAIVHRRAKISVLEKDLTSLDQAAQSEAIEAYIVEDRRRGFALKEAPLLRLALFRIGARAFRLVLGMHHLLVDGWSMPLVFEEVFELYAAARERRTPRLPDRRPYRDYVAWLHARDASRPEAFWRRYLGGFTTPTPLVVDRQNPVGARYEDVFLELPDEASRTLDTLAREHGVTRATLAYAAWGNLLSR